MRLIAEPIFLLCNPVWKMGQHTYMFGGSYKYGAMGIMKSLIGWAEGEGEE